jgi:hypothetical protein
MVNCVLWANRANYGSQIAIKLLEEEEYRTYTRLTITYCDVQGGRDAVNADEGCELYWSDNIESDPYFADSGSWDTNDTPEDASDDFWIGGDYHLKSQARHWDSVGESWVVDDVTSPCIDAGDPNSAVAFEPFPNGGIVNMGAYGGTAEASKSPSGLHSKYGGGTGEPNHPYLIYTPEQLNTIGLHAEDRDSHFKLMADIDLSGLGVRDFNIIGTSTNAFGGVFDGNGHTISNFTYISTDVDGVALFSYVEGAQAEIRDLGLIDPVIDAGIVNPIFEEDRVEGNHAGSLINYLRSGAVKRCYVRGGRVSADNHIGGLVAYNRGGTITGCSSTAEVVGFKDVGGLVGYNGGTMDDCFSMAEVVGANGVGGLVGHSGGMVVNCHAISIVTGKSSVGGLAGFNGGILQDCSSKGGVMGDDSVGGLVGKHRSSETIQGSFSTGDVTGIYHVGGLVGFSLGDITKCYSRCSVSGGRTVGGLVGFIGSFVIDHCYSNGNIVHEPIEDLVGNPRIHGLVGSGNPPEDEHNVPSQILRSFWDIETSGRTLSFGGTGLTTAEMQTAGTYLEAGWDFVGETGNGADDIWWIIESQDYPRLWWEMIPEN